MNDRGESWKSLTIKLILLLVLKQFRKAIIPVTMKQIGAAFILTLWRRPAMRLQGQRWSTVTLAGAFMLTT